MRIFTASLILIVVVGGTTIAFPAKSEAAVLVLATWQLFFADEFNASGDLVGWNLNRGDGNYWVDTGGGFLHLESNIDIDYIRIYSRQGATPNPLIYLPFILK